MPGSLEDKVEKPAGPEFRLHDTADVIKDTRGTREKTRERTRGKRTDSVSATKWNNLKNLKNLMDAGFITETEFKERKIQLIDEMTGTTLSSTRGGSRSVSRASRSTMSSKSTLLSPAGSTCEIAVEPKGPPDFAPIVAEAATKFTYDLVSRSWQQDHVKVKLDTVPFAKGALRLVYHLQDLSSSYYKRKKKTNKDRAEMKDGEGTYVAKISMDPRDNKTPDIYFKDVETQAVAGYYAKQFNEYNPPKIIAFVKAWILRLDDRETQPICGVERFIDGPYRKHNNNFGFVNDEERNTPQAFSHFSYESSNRSILVVDIQGVGDMYTDPQVHSADGKGYGKGNMGQRGIDKFIQTHRCNAICRYLKLPPINANYSGLGTLPVTQFMKYEHVEVQVMGPLPPLSAQKVLAESAIRDPLVGSKQRGGTQTPSCFSMCNIL